MKQASSYLGAIALSLLPICLQNDGQATAPGTAPNPVVEQEAPPADIRVYTVGASSAAADDAMNDVADCIGSCYRSFESQRGPIRDTRQALNYFYPGAVEQLQLEEKYRLVWDFDTEEWLLVCYETALFHVTTGAGRVAVEVTEENM